LARRYCLKQARVRRYLCLHFFFTSKSPKRKFSIYFYGPTRKLREITEKEIGDWDGSRHAIMPDLSRFCFVETGRYDPQRRILQPTVTVQSFFTDGGLKTHVYCTNRANDLLPPLDSERTQERKEERKKKKKKIV
jgi:hypothetical protein